MSEEKYGIEKLKSIATGLAKAQNVVWDYTHGGGWLSLIGFKDVVPSFTVDYKVALEEAKDVSEPERETLEAHYKSQLNAQLQGYENSFVDSLEEVVDFVEDAVSTGKVFYSKGLALFEKIKSMISPK
jgi:hypothetical protein